MPYIGAGIQKFNTADGLTVSGNASVSGTTALTGNATAAGTLDVTGAVTADAGVSIDNITIDGTEIDLSSGDLTIDVAGELILDTDLQSEGNGILLKDDGTTYGNIFRTGSDLVIMSSASDEDLIFKGNDGGSTITALTLDMSAAGNATFNGSIFSGGNVVVPSGNGIDFSATSDASGATSELLDDYEEGTFTPAFGEGVTASSYGDQKGAYTKVGRLVTFQIELDATNGTVSTNSGGVRITGLPFATASSGARGGAWFTFNNNFYNVDAGPTAQINTNDTEIRFYRSSGQTLLGNSTGLNPQNDVHLMGFYFTA